jgi:hypothetical protein
MTSGFLAAPGGRSHGTRDASKGSSETHMARSAAIRSIPVETPSANDEVVETTLLELVQTIGELTDDDREVVATVVELLRAGRVRLIGNFRGQRIALA